MLAGRCALVVLAAQLLLQSQAAVVLNEVADKGSTGTCSGDDWVELYNNGGTSVALAGYMLHDDNGPTDPDAYTFAAGAQIPAGGFLLLCCNSVTQLKFKIRGQDTVTLLDATGSVVSTSGQLPGGGQGAFDKSYAFDGASWAYTMTATPAAANVITADSTSPMQRLIDQNALGEAFFGMDGNGLPVSGFEEVVDLRFSMTTAEKDYMMNNKEYEVYSQWTGLEVRSSTDNSLLTQLSAGGRIRPRGQSTLVIPACLGWNSVPFKVDFASNDQTQTLYGVEELYLRHHMSDPSYMREWSMHRMLARFGLPHLRTRTVRVFINDEHLGLYEAMEPPSQEYVFARSFPDVDLSNHALYKVKTMAASCGTWLDSQSATYVAGHTPSACRENGGYDNDCCALTNQRSCASGYTLSTEGSTVCWDGGSIKAYTYSCVASAESAAVEPQYSFDRGTHRDSIQRSSDWNTCANIFFATMGKENQDLRTAYHANGQDCGETLVEEGLVDRDLGQKTFDPQMKTFINKHLGGKACSDRQCSNSDLQSDVDVEQWLRNFAVYAVTMTPDSPIGNGNNYLLANSGDGKGWKIVQYDHNNAAEGGVADLLCGGGCGLNMVNWAITRPTCTGLHKNPLVGPLLSDASNHARYLELVREFTNSVLNNPALVSQMQSHAAAIRSFVSDDPFDGGRFDLELSPTAAEWNSPGFPLLSVYKARGEDVTAQFAALDSGTYPRLPDQVDNENEICQDWRNEEGPPPCDSKQICPWNYKLKAAAMYYDANAGTNLPCSGAQDWAAAGGFDTIEGTCDGIQSWFASQGCCAACNGTCSDDGGVDIGAVIGGVVGAIVALALIGVVLKCARKKGPGPTGSPSAKAPSSVSVSATTEVVAFDSIEGAATAPAPATSATKVERLQELAKRRDTGEITEEQFTAEKTEILAEEGA